MRRRKTWRKKSKKKRKKKKRKTRMRLVLGPHPNCSDFRLV